MSSANMTDEEHYSRAVSELNTLGRSPELMKDVLANRKKYMYTHIPVIRQLLEALSISQDDLDQLSVIHVAGTKGKGSTCAYTESILRHHGYRTLVYCSPHIRELRERIMINGQILSYKAFANYFWEVYAKLKHLKNQDNSVVHYFNFLMALGFYVSVKEHQAGNIDVVVMECMVGGEYDYTNVFSHPVVCGVTSLGLDHTPSLGNTVASIAWHKAGIFKKNVPAHTVVQFPEAMAVLVDRAQEKGATLGVCPPLDNYGESIELGIGGEVQKLNASLALQLSKTWVEHKEGRPNQEINKPELDVFELETADREGLKKCFSPGKDHVIKLDHVTFHLDGAHTLESLQHCLKWYDGKTKMECQSLMDNGTISENTAVRKVLVFSKNSERDSKRLVSPFTDYPFDDVMMCVSVTNNKETSIDHQAVTENMEDKIACAKECMACWRELRLGGNNNNQVSDQHLVYAESIAHSYQLLRQADEGDQGYTQVLVTGSTVFVGRYLKYLEDIISRK